LNTSELPYTAKHSNWTDKSCVMIFNKHPSSHQHNSVTEQMTMLEQYYLQQC